MSGGVSAATASNSTSLELICYFWKKSNFDQNNLSEEKKEITNGEQDQSLLDVNGGQIEENVELTDLQA